jgi:5-methylcytosine-specific restriction endonuclease McrA
MAKKYSDLTEEEKAKRREAVKRHSKRKHAALALAAGREPFVPGRPRQFSDEERLERRKIAVQKYKDANADRLRADAARRAREKRHAKALAEGRTPGKIGREFSPNPLTPEQKKQRRRELYQERHGDHARKHGREYYAENREKILEYHEQRRRSDSGYRETHNVHNRNRRAKLKGAPEKHSRKDIQWLWDKQNGCCVFCLKPLIRGKFHVDHHIPLARGGSNDRKNLRLLHKKCNLEKSWRDPLEHAKEHGMLFW